MKKILYLIIIIFLSSFFASRIQSSWGRVKVTGIKIPTQNGQWLVADLFKPISATKKNPAPLVINIPGFQRSKETLSNIAIELSRRGIVVITIDPYAQGGSSSSNSRRAATTEGYGMFALVDYVYNTNNLNYIDKSKISSSGHSAGGLAAMRGAQHFGAQAIKDSSLSKLHSAYISGMIRMGFNQKDINKVKSNVGISYALRDEGAWQNELKNGNMKKAPEALRLLNHQIGNESLIDSIVIGKYYGSLDNRTLTTVHNEDVIHPLQPYNKGAIENQINFFLKVFNIKDTIEPKNQVWFWKELLTLISLISSFLLLIPLTAHLLNFPYFNELVHKVPKKIPFPKGKSKYIFWASIVVGTLIAAFSFIPLSELSKVIFSSAQNRNQTWFFPQRMNNAVLMWAFLNGVVGFLIFFLSYLFAGKDGNVNPKNWGLQINNSEIFKTLTLSFLIFTIYFLLLNIIYYIFHVDYRFLFVGVRTFRPITLALIPMYVPFFLIFFISNSLRVNSSLRIEGVQKYKSMAFSGLVTASGLMIILFIQYFSLWITGTVFWKEGWLYVNLLFAIVPIMFFLPFFQRVFFNLTGKIYLGPLVMCLIFIMILMSNTVSYFPI